MAKAFFVGEDLVDTGDDPAFYARAVVTDVGYGAATDGLFTSTYAQPPTVIKWEILEDLLVGRIIYNRIDGADGKGDTQNSLDGQIAYAFPISGHFDIRRDYNPSTGEESNVIVENTSDRAWDKREYFRVDWSRNLNVDAYDFDTLSLMGIYGGVTYEPLSYYVNDPKHPDAPHFATNEGYFDITTKAFATPGIIDLSSFGWGIDSYPACYLPNDVLGGSAPFGNCNPSEITLRMSFRRVEVSDYEPQDWDGQKFEKFGIFYGERHGYARNYGIVDENWHRFAARYNIWERSHAYQPAEGGCESGWVESVDYPGECEKPCYTPETTPPDQKPNRDCGADINACSMVSFDPTTVQGNGTADECEAVGNGSQCDQFKQKCTMPYQDRTPKPVVWHYTKGSDPDYFEGTYWATNEWDVALRSAVRFAQYGECVTALTAVGSALDAAQATCNGEFPIFSGQQEENEDLVNLATEVDDCKAALGGWLESPKGEPWSEDRVTECNKVADSVGAQRGYSAGVIDMAKMDEMVTLCHSPVSHHDSPLCVQDIQRLMPQADREKDPRVILGEDVTAADCDAQWEMRFDKPSEVDQQLLAQCDNTFYVRIGDLRYHQVNAVRTPQTPSPWGIMVDADDPRTGEKIHASINIWSHVTDLATQGHVDMMRYIKGELKTSDITEGTYVRDWARAASAASGKGALGTMDKATLEHRKFSAADGRNFHKAHSSVEAPRDAARNGNQNPLSNPAGHSPEVMQKTKEFYSKHVTKIRAGVGQQSVNKPFTEARRLAGQNTNTEAALITEPMMQLAGFDQSQINAAQGVGAGQIGSSTLASASILRGLNPQIKKDLRQSREIALAARGACILSDDHIMAPTPNTLVGMADVMERKFGAFNPESTKAEQLAHAEKIRYYLKQKYQYGVILHEMGHSIGHRHNFVSSYYAFGYRPQYWQTRTKDGTQINQCEDVSATGDDCVGPRYFDPPTAFETDNLQAMFQQSSVMDYPGDLSQDMIGLGAYDYAAARMFYGNTVAVLATEYPADHVLAGQPTENGVDGDNADTVLNLSDTFGGIVGYQYQKKGGASIHYTGLQENMAMVTDCKTVDPANFKPKNWNDKNGVWDPLIDGLIVGENGTYTRCKSPPVDYVPYNRLRKAVETADLDKYEDLKASDVESGNAGFYGSGPTVDASGRLRMPYGFATDGWADTGNAAVFRHDNGADQYELFNFLITEQETRHIFDNYRRQRTSFSVRTQADRILGRYNEKMRDAAKGFGLFANLYREVLAEFGADFDTEWPFYANRDFADSALVAGIAMDHFSRQFVRPQSGPHFAYANWQFPTGATGLTSEDLVWRSIDSGFNGPGNGNGDAEFAIPNGATGYFGQVSYGGKLVENRLPDNQGEYNRDYVIDAGSYYDKVYAPYLMTESADNFISDSLGDFIDPRYRAVSMADVFPDGYRRFLANQLTGEDFLKGARLASNNAGPAQRPNPIVDDEGFPGMGIGWVTWWTPEPEVCFPGENGIVCSTYGCDETALCGALSNPDAPANTTVVEPQVGWEQWKWLIAQTLLYLPENGKNEWINLLGIWELGADTDPGFPNRIELHLPDGRIYIARTYGTEDIFGRTVQRGVAARVLEYANELAYNAYVCTDQTAPDGSATWCIPEVIDGKISIRHDPAIQSATCTDITPEGCTCASNRACMALEKYQPLPAFIRQTMHDFRMADATMLGIYD